MNRVSVWTRAALLVGTLVLGALVASSCNHAPPSCEQAIGHAYAMGCGVTADGQLVSEGDAIDGCVQMKAEIDANTCPCGSEFGAGLSCMDGVGQSDCSTCHEVMVAYSECLAAHCSGS